MIKHYADTFIYAVMGGICIALGGTAYLCTESNILGAVLFAVGLFTICTMGFYLFTGKVAYIIDNKPSYLIDLVFIWLGNFAGTFLVAEVLGFTRIGNDLYKRATAICELKLSDNLLSVFILAIFCNLLIFIAVDGFMENHHSLGKYLGLLFGVVSFIFCGFEHSIADMFYFTIGKVWSLNTLLFIFVITLGNIVGGLLVPSLRAIHKKLSA